MATVNVNFSTKKQTVPATTDVSNRVNVLLMQGATVRAIKDVFLPATSVSFDGVSDGTYTIKAQRASSVGGPVGDPSESEPFDVVNTVDIDVPDVVTVTFG